MPRSRQAHIDPPTIDSIVSIHTSPPPPSPPASPPPQNKYNKRQRPSFSITFRSCFRSILESRANTFVCVLTAIWLLGCAIIYWPTKRQHTFRRVYASDGLKPLTDPAPQRNGYINLDSSDTFEFEDFTQDKNLEAIFALEKKTLAVLVVGLESSGTKEVSKVTSHALKLCPYGSWEAHGACFDKSNGVAVIHRSLPFGKDHSFADISSLALKLHNSGFETKVVAVTRDQTISLRAKTRDHQHDATLAAKEHLYGGKLLRQFLHLQLTQACPAAEGPGHLFNPIRRKTPRFSLFDSERKSSSSSSSSSITETAPQPKTSVPCVLSFVFSYESLVLLRRSYFELYLRALDVPVFEISERVDSLSVPSQYTKDGNYKYITRSPLCELIFSRAD